uniref:Uncharacterized protein n=1 Tax=viral metagenome TaxID=1070528 RepID=A0A6C0EHS6_9ZZZZ
MASDFKTVALRVRSGKQPDLPIEAWTVIQVQARKSTTIPNHWRVLDHGIVHDSLIDDTDFSKNPIRKRIDVGVEGDTVVSIVPITRIGTKKYIPRTRH